MVKRLWCSRGEKAEGSLARNAPGQERSLEGHKGPSEPGGQVHWKVCSQSLQVDGMM